MEMREIGAIMKLTNLTFQLNLADSKFAAMLQSGVMCSGEENLNLVEEKHNH